jgi:hypothetical protein
MADIIDVRSSRGVVKDFNFNFGSDMTTGLKPSDIHYDILLDMFRRDPVLSTAIDITVDSCTNNSFKFIGDNTRTVKEATKLFFEKYDFDRVLDNILYSMLIYGDAYLELRREGNQVTELHPLETTEMFIDYDKNGEVKHFIQKPPGKGKSAWIYFTTDDVIHFRLKWIGSRVYSYNPLEPIGNSYATKIYGYNYLKHIFTNLPPELVYVLKGANDEQIEEFKANLRRIQSNPKEKLIVKVNQDDEFDVKEFQVKFDSGLSEVLGLLKHEVLMITRVPPIWVGMLQAGNRSTDEALIYPFEVRIRKLQHIISSDINKFLLTKLGLQNLKFVFNPVAFSSEKSIMEIASQMKAIGLETKGEIHPIVHYLREKGINIPDETFIPSAEEMQERMMAMQPEQGQPGAPKAQIQSDGAPSRQRENKKTDSMTSKLDDKGVSAAGKKKQEERKAKLS